MWKWVIAVASLPLGAGALVYGIGAMLPRTHVARAEALLPAPAAQVAAMVREVEAQPQWRGAVTAVEIVERRERGLRYIEHSGGDAIAFDFVEEVPGARFRSTIADPQLPFGGFWTIALASEGEGTRVAIEEHGEVRSPVYRFFAALVFGHEATMKAYLADLERAVRR
ncbi:MAG TPA: SRPBCC family protein [Allosphingosinicella sp.]|nr:SRPBCC family protein [Allosphingosinicella sp.]